MQTPSPRYWYDSFPGVEVETVHPILDPYGTPYGGPDGPQVNEPHVFALDNYVDEYAPYARASQNRGGIQ